MPETDVEDGRSEQLADETDCDSMGSSDIHPNFAIGDEKNQQTFLPSTSHGNPRDVFIGNIQDHMNFHHERRQHKTIIPYDPTHKWWEPPLKAWFPDQNHEILALLFVWNITVVLVLRYTSWCGHHEMESNIHFCNEEEWILSDDTFHSTLGVGLFLLLAFRANQSYNRFWEGRTFWGKVKNQCRDLVRQICFNIRVTKEDEALERRRAVAMVSAFASTLKLHLRKERNCLPELGGILCFQDIVNIEKSIVMPQFCADAISYYLNQQRDRGNLTDYQMAIMNSSGISLLIDSLGALERIRKTPIPLSFTLHLRFIMLFWLIFYPLSLVVFYGWYTIPLALLVDYVVLGIESMSCEVEDPFGYDKNDLDLCSFCKVLEKELFEILERVEFCDCSKLFDTKEVLAMNTDLIAHATDEERRTLSFLANKIQKQ